MFPRLSAILTVIAASALVGCGIVSDDPSDEKDPAPKPVEVSACSGTTDASADADVAAANQQLQANMDDMARAMNNGEWSGVQASAPTTSGKVYDAVLAKYPGHCTAQFGKAITTLANIVNNPDLDEVVDSLTKEDVDTATSPYDAYLDGSLEKRQEILLKIALGTEQSSPMTVTRAQKVVESLLPTVDTAIALLSNVMAQTDFAVDFNYVRTDGSTRRIQLDKGEVGPGLAVLKSIKALLISMVAVQAEVSLDGTYDWLKELNGIEDEDFDHLTPAQTKALDHVISLTEKNSPFLTIRSQYQTEFAGIPALLESALDDLKAGMQYELDEAAKGTAGQEYDPYVVGTWTGADLDPADLQLAMENLERIRKYLKGPVTITWASGTQSLVVDAPKFFKITDGYQDFLPYHKVLPYTQWNDTIAADTLWDYDCSMYSTCGEELGAAIAKAAFGTTAEYLDYDLAYYTTSVNGSTLGDIFGISYDYAYKLYTSNSTAIYLKAPSNCTAEYIVSGEPTVRTIAIPNCKEEIDMGDTSYQYIYDIDVVTNGPFVFTDAAGTATFGKNLGQEIEDLYDAKGLMGFADKIIFPDPTFGGVFPKLTQQTIWSTLENLKGIKPRIACKNETETAEMSGNSEFVDYFGYDCSEAGLDQVMPSNPSDLDVFTYYFH